MTSCKDSEKAEEVIVIFIKVHKPTKKSVLINVNSIYSKDCILSDPASRVVGKK